MTRVRRPQRGRIAAGGAHRLRLPGRRVHAVRDGPDRRGVRDVRPHGARGAAVQLGDRVRGTRETKPGHGHAERIAAQRLHLGGRELERGAEAPQVVERMLLVAGAHRRVRGEHDAPPGVGPRLLERHAGLHALRDHLHAGEHRVPLVEVVGGDRNAEPVQGAQPADPEQHLLRDPHVAARLVEAVRDPAVLGAQRLDQVQGHVAVALGHPHHARNLLASHPHPHPHARVVQERVVVGRELLERLAVLPDPLHAVAAVPAQADRHHRAPEVARRLDEVARQDAEAARIDRKGLGESVLHAQERDVRNAGHAGAFLEGRLRYDPCGERNTIGRRGRPVTPRREGAACEGREGLRRPGSSTRERER